MRVNIRKAKRRDCKKMLKLIEELAHYEEASDKVTVSLNEFEESGFGRKPIWEALIAEQEGRIVGMSLFYVRYSTWKGRRLYLEDLIVTADCRGQGIGKMLFDHTLYLSKKREYNGMVWQVLDWNEPAINFYKKYNVEFDDRWINVEINN